MRLDAKSTSIAATRVSDADVVHLEVRAGERAPETRGFVDFGDDLGRGDGREGRRGACWPLVEGLDPAVNAAVARDPGARRRAGGARRACRGGAALYILRKIPANLPVWAAATPFTGATHVTIVTVLGLVRRLRR